jgi:hypothetical protein
VATRTVRVIRVWDVKVKADYGDDDQALLDKAQPEGKPEERRNLLPDEGKK